MHEFIGYIFEPNHDREKNAFFVGPARSGKSTIAEGIQALFGEHPTVVNLTPQQIADTQFDVALLGDAALNLVNDINATPINDSDQLKRVFSGEHTKMEHKYQDAFFDNPTAKHLFTANWLLRVKGTDEALFRRILIFEFLNQIPEDQKDPSIKKEITNSEEIRRVILRRALDGRDRLNEQGYFTADRNQLETGKAIWQS